MVAKWHEKKTSGIRTLNGRKKMTDPHEKAVKDRKEAAEDVKEAYKDLCEAAGMPIEEDL